MAEMRTHMRMEVFLREARDPDDEDTLYVRIQVVCEACGQDTFLLAGHHVKPLIALLQTVVDKVDPALVEPGEGGTTIYAAPQNPKLN